jgi:hypothetical protein
VATQPTWCRTFLPGAHPQIIVWTLPDLAEVARLPFEDSLVCALECTDQHLFAAGYAVVKVCSMRLHEALAYVCMYAYNPSGTTASHR